MLSGINTDIQYKGEVYHIQTEDGGPVNPIITTILFKGGAIFSSKKTNYADIIQADSYQEAVREMMKEQHKNMVRDLAAGKFERPSEPGEETKGSPSPSDQPESSRKKSLDDLILDYLSEKKETLD